MGTVESAERQTPVSSRILIGCVAENNRKFLSQALRLLISLRRFGGAFQNADFMICVVDDCAPIYEEKFRALDAILKIVDRFHPANPFSNKLRLFEQPEISSYESVLLLDCDTLLVQDPTPYLKRGFIQAKIADLPTVPNEILVKLCLYFDVPVPETRYRTTVAMTPTIWYCNSGVVSIPGSLISRLAPAWGRFVLKLLEAPHLLGQHQLHCNQAALAMAFLSDPLFPFSELPVEMNLPTHLELPQSLQQSDPVILHYHDQVDEDGYLLPSRYPLVQQRIASFNNHLGEFLHDTVEMKTLGRCS